MLKRIILSFFSRLSFRVKMKKNKKRTETFPVGNIRKAEKTANSGKNFGIGRRMPKKALRCGQFEVFQLFLKYNIFL